ncbi:hypothetical protein BT93_C2062 [Corymbia citriodora subsp. variegata]|nr:hypothetical protein BT93_C2062 [Corymbia citriodora subsp. variegata]
MASEAEEKWEERIDFFSLHKSVPMIDTCHRVEGVSHQPGCIRNCSGRRSSADTLEDVFTDWALEKLLATDPVNKSFTCEIVDCNNVGFKSMAATMKLTAVRDAEEEDGCGMSSSFMVNPIEGWTEKDLTDFFNAALQVMAERIEAALSSKGE